jgi:hypothetical protein
VLETLSAGLAPLPRIDLSPTELERVRAVQGLPPDLTQLLLGWQHTVELAEQLGLPASTDRARVLMVAGQLAGRFRALAVQATAWRVRSITSPRATVRARAGVLPDPRLRRASRQANLTVGFVVLDAPAASQNPASMSPDRAS